MILHIVEIFLTCLQFSIEVILNILHNKFRGTKIDTISCYDNKRATEKLNYDFNAFNAKEKRKDNMTCYCHGNGSK